MIYSLGMVRSGQSKEKNKRGKCLCSERSHVFCSERKDLIKEAAISKIRLCDCENVICDEPGPRMETTGPKDRKVTFLSMSSFPASRSCLSKNQWQNSELSMEKIMIQEVKLGMNKDINNDISLHIAKPQCFFFFCVMQQKY